MLIEPHENARSQANVHAPAGLASAEAGARGHTLAARVAWTLGILLVACAILFIAGYIVLALIRVRYPFELEWMEGSMVDAVKRLLLGQKLYASPSVDYVPYLYTPLYFYLSALTSAVTGVGFLPLRLVSIAASLGCLALIYLIVARETASRPAGIVAAGLFAATYRLSGLWFDIARVDSTYLFTLLAAASVIRFGRSRATPYLAGGLIWLTFFSKQTALAMAAPLMIYYFLGSWRSGVRLIATVAVLVVASTALLNWLNDGWYTYYIFGVPSTHPLEKSMYLGFWRQDILAALPIATLVALAYFAIRALRPAWKVALFYLALAAGLVLGAWGGRLNWGGYLNAIMPAYAAIAVLAGNAVGRALRPSPDRATPAPQVLQVLLCSACLLQFGLLYFDPRSALPTAKDLEAGRQFLQAIRDIPGDVYVPFHGYLPSLAGKKSYAHAMPVADFVNLGPDGPLKAGLVEEFKKAVDSQRFGAVVLDEGKWKGWLPGDIGETYARVRSISRTEDAFWPVTGYRTRPTDLLLPLPTAQAMKVDAAWQSGIHLLRARLPRVGRGQNTVPVILVWTGLSPMETNWKVFVHLLDESGDVRAQADGYPDNGNAPTNGWEPGKEIVDRHVVMVDGGLGPGKYRVQVGLYDETTGERLPMAAGADSYELPGPLSVAK